MANSQQSPLWKRLEQVQKRLGEIADLEAQGALFASGASDGRLDPERERPTNETTDIMGRLDQLCEDARTLGERSAVSVGVLLRR